MTSFLRSWHNLPNPERPMVVLRLHPRVARPSCSPSTTHYAPLGGSKWSFSLFPDTWRVLCLPVSVPGRATPGAGQTVGLGKGSFLC